MQSRVYAQAARQRRRNFWGAVYCGGRATLELSNCYTLRETEAQAEGNHAQETCKRATCYLAHVRPLLLATREAQCKLH